MIGTENSRRFINSYNNIDKVLRSVYGFKSNISFTDLVRRCAEKSQLVRKYEDELIGWSRLRNAIVHNSYDNKVIAEPHDSVVEEIELAEKLLKSPPPIAAAAHKAVTLSSCVNLKKAVMLMTSGGYSNVPIIKDGVILGVASNKLIVEAIAKAINAGRDLDAFLEDSEISCVLSSTTEHYCIVPQSLTIDAALNMFHVNKKLRILLITPQGQKNEEITSVVTIEDFSSMSDLIFSY